jgi:hypothetical protein
MAVAPESDSSPTNSALVLAVVPVSVTHPRSMSSRFLLSPGHRPALGVPEARP